MRDRRPSLHVHACLRGLTGKKGGSGHECVDRQTCYALCIDVVIHGQWIHASWKLRELIKVLDRMPSAEEGALHLYSGFGRSCGRYQMHVRSTVTCVVSLSMFGRRMFGDGHFVHFCPCDRQDFFRVFMVLPIGMIATLALTTGVGARIPAYYLNPTVSAHVPCAELG